MWKHIAGLKGTTTVVLTTHYLEEADALADRIAVIDAGSIVAQGTPDELKRSIGGVPLTFVEASNVTPEALDALRATDPIDTRHRVVRVRHGDVQLRDGAGARSESALLARLLTTPLRSSDFVAAYSLPYVVVAIVQGIVLFAIGAALGLAIDGSVLLVGLVLVTMALCYVALGMILGSLCSVAQVSGGYTVVLLLTIFGGAWFDLEEIGGVFERVANVLPFKHALDALRAVMADGAGFGDVADDFLWMFGYTIVAVVAAVIVFRRSMIE